MGNIVAIVGRPNVGKSTLFNRLTQTRQAIVDDEAGTTRDRNYGKVEWTGKKFSLIDTGGWVVNSDDIFEEEINKQVHIAIEEADVILFVGRRAKRHHRFGYTSGSNSSSLEETVGFSGKQGRQLRSALFGSRVLCFRIRRSFLCFSDKRLGVAVICWMPLLPSLRRRKRKRCWRNCRVLL